MRNNFNDHAVPRWKIIFVGSAGKNNYLCKHVSFLYDDRNTLMNILFYWNARAMITNEWHLCLLSFTSVASLSKKVFFYWDNLSQIKRYGLVFYTYDRLLLSCVHFLFLFFVLDSKEGT